MTLEVSPTAGGALRLTPYPFDIDPLPVDVPVRISPGISSRAAFDFHWNAIEKRMLRFTFTN